MLTHSRIAPRGQAKSFCSRLSAGVACACITALLIAGVLLLAPSAGAQNWTLAWSDEFNGPAGSIPSSSIWSFKDKGTNSNGEVEVYCAPTDNVAPCSTATPNVFEDGNGNMVMRAMNVGGTWTSVRMNTSLSELPQYGRIEARMKLTVGDGLWPAFWMLGQDILTGTPWPTCGEIDIMEWVPQDAATSTTGTEHGPGYSGCCGTGNAHYTFPNGGRIDDAGYHTYGVVWLQNSIQWYRDDPTNVFFTVTSSDIPSGDAWVFNQPFYIIFNQAVGGNYPTPGPDSSTPNPSDVLVDYVRVYSASACTAPTVPTGLAATAASSTEINLSWTASTSSDCTVTYSVFRSTTSGFTPSTSNQVASNVTGTTYSDNGLASSTTYYYLVEATDYGNTTAPSNQAGATTAALGTQLLAIDSGSTTTVSPFVADEDFTGGTTSTHANTINTSNVKNPAPAAVYQTDRVGNFSYTIGGFTAGTNYVVRLHFCETYFTSAGSRTFNVSINGAQVLTDFDIYATAGGQNIANIQQFTEPANSSGQFVITVTSVVNNSFLAGIEIDSAGASCSTPTAPSGLTATATSSSQINLSWTASSSSCSGITYNVFRSTTSGFTPSSGNEITSGVTATTYSNTGLAASTTYYYLVEATNLGGTSAASNQASATTQAAATSCSSLCINAGGPLVTPFVADEDFTGGGTISHTNTIDTSKVSNPAPAAVYQKGRDGNFTYTIGGFTASSMHTVRLHFCETYFTASGKRTFNVSINGTTVLTDFDIYATAGGQNIANIQQFTEAANSSGQYVVVFTSVVNNSLVSGIEID
ncbi:MAG: malectin domain-containing carbohydrate-binding protein [Candidatus Acidiferrales bacterium]